MLHPVNRIIKVFARDNVDYTTFGLSLFVTLAIAFFILYDAETARITIAKSYDYIVGIFGPAYLILAILSFFFLIYLCISTHGSYRLGGATQTPEFSYGSWIGMLFCSGIGGGLVYWSGVEWAYYVDIPPFGIEPGSDESFALATAYGLFHWGVSAWAIYGIPAVALSISFYKYNLNTLRLSSSLRGLGFKNIEDTLLGRSIDLIFVISTVGAAGGTIGSYLPMLSSGFSEIFNIEKSFILNLQVLFICVGLYGFSVYSGLKKGIKRLSNINIILAAVFLLIILLTGPASNILENSIEGLAYTFEYFWSMSTLGISEQSDFADAWTIFYWAWWVAFGPLVALFIARISKGRTLRELILGMLVFGSMGTWLFYLIFGGYSMSLEQSGSFAVMDSLREVGHAETAIAVVRNMPFNEVMLILFCIITLIFVTTSYDSMSFVIAYHVQKNTSEHKDPDKELRLFWAIVLGLLPAALIVYSDHSVATDLILLTSLPLLFIYPFMALAIYKDLNKK
jgi:BCCT family betaine/carnitine transporter|tara:strand:+ start:819 stop:2348 length:1530 start_codon:yes stop_codon:yes gene_type:complete